MIFLWFLLIRSAFCFELLMGGLTLHHTNYQKVNRHNSNKITPDGRLIANPLVGLRGVCSHPEKDVFFGPLLFVGKNSIDEPIAGGGISLGFEITPTTRAAALFAFYGQNNAKFRSRGVHPFSIYEVNATGIVPVHGIEVVWGKAPFVNVLVSPAISNVGIGWVLP